MRALRRLITTLVLRLLGLFGPAKGPPLGAAPLRTIILFRFGGIGDVVVSTGLIRSLRVLYPTARIMVATAPAFAPVLEGNPDLDRVLVSAEITPYAGPSQLLRAIRTLRRWSDPPLDLAIFAHNYVYMLWLALFVRARYKLGFDTDERGFDFALTHSAPIHTPNHPGHAEHLRHPINEHFHDLLRHLRGEALPALPPRIALSAAEAAEAQASLAARGLGRPLLALAPGGSEALKIWPIERFAELARRYLREGRGAVVVLGGAGEAVLARHFADLDRGLWFAAGQLSLRQSMAIVQAADLVVGSDTGLIHVAAALAVPTVTIFGPTTPSVYGYEGHHNRVLKADLPCMPCEAERCRLLPAGTRGAVPPCLDQVTVEAVIAAIKGQLGPGRPGAVP